LFPKRNYSPKSNPFFLGGEGNSLPQEESKLIPFSSREKTSPFFPRAFRCPREKLKKLPKGYFFHPFQPWKTKKIREKDQTMYPLIEGGDSNHQIINFSREILGKKDN
jgi:hypothetical protein